MANGFHKNRNDPKSVVEDINYPLTRKRYLYYEIGEQQITSVSGYDNGPIKNNDPKDPAYYMNDPKFRDFTYEECLSAYMNYHYKMDIEKSLTMRFGAGEERRISRIMDNIFHPEYPKQYRDTNWPHAQRAAIKEAILYTRKHLKNWNEHKDDPYVTSDDIDKWNDEVLREYAKQERLDQIRLNSSYSGISQAITVNDILSLVVDGAGIVFGAIMLFDPATLPAGLMLTLVNSDNFIKDSRVIFQKLNGTYKNNVGTLGGSIMTEDAYAVAGIFVNITTGAEGTLKLIGGFAKASDKASFTVNSIQNAKGVYDVFLEYE